MFPWQHAFMQDAADEHSIGTVDDYMLPLLDSPVSIANLIASASHLRSFSQPLEAIVETCQVTLRLAQTPPVHCVIGDLDQVEPGQP